MGIIQRQSIKYTIVNFVGTFIGFLSVVLIYPLDRELYGYFQSLHSFATLLVPFLGWGIHGAVVKFYPDFVQRGKASGFLSFTLIIATLCAAASLIILSGIYMIARPLMYRLFDNFQFVEANKSGIIVLGVILLYSSIFLFHASARYRIVIPDLINNVGLKIFLPFLILAVYLGIVSKGVFVPIILIYFFIVSIALLVYLLRLDTHDWKPGVMASGRGKFRELIGFMFFSVLNGLGAGLALRIDTVMVSAMISVEAVTIYAIIMTISNVMEIPNKAINQIAGPVISASWQNGNRENINEVYRKSSLYGLLAGMWLFLVLYFIWPDILALMPGKLNVDLNTVLLIFTFLGMARIIDLMTGVNSVIISYSDEYRFHMYFLLVLGFTNVMLNYFLLKSMGLPGAALATLLSYFVFNLLKYVFVRSRFRMTLVWTHVWQALVCFILVFAALYFIRPPFAAFINIIIKGTLSTSLFLAAVWWLNPGGEARKTIQESYHSLTAFLPKAIRKR